ncbi:hypothetical protein G5I_04187 [Acromyrmex echinatior]|uniref:Uncharacterized protein n=1 Tax=Acromyrmex echinatior TaxID=103372 RepID=F4WEY3_ACREC|nr:hypothetical protein G5I_04187 [Acromyrmex echinatior]
MCAANQFAQRNQEAAPIRFANSHLERSADRNYYPESPTTKFELDNHRESGIIKCPECYTSASEDEKSHYQEVLRHYIHLGFPDRFEFCSACSVLTITLRILNL